jgi:hypothetical protein
LKKFAVLARWGLGLGVMAFGVATLLGSGGGGGGESEPPPPQAQAPSITAQPASATVADGSTATFSVAATGTAPLSYSWRRNGTAIAGATDSNYATPTLALADSGASYTVVVSNSAGSATSAAAVLTVNPAPPTVTQQPQAVGAVAGQTAQFSVAATGSAPLAYQWRRDGAPIAGATAATYTTPALTLGDSGARFSVLVNNAAGSVTSAEAVLTVSATAVAPTISAQPQAVTVNAPRVATFSVAATGTAPLAYQWRRDGVDIPGATTSSYTTPALTTTDSGANYSVRVSNPAGAQVSSSAALTVLPARAWAVGQLLESGDTPVDVREEGIDDEGNVTVAFIKTEATRATVYATRATPGPAGTAPVWSAPVVVDDVPGLTGTAANTEGLRVAVAPAGHAAVLFTRRAPCTASTYSTNGTCTYRYVARYLAGGAGWEAAVPAGDAPGATSASDVTLRINDNGDIAFIGTGWIRAGTGTFSARLGTWRRARGAAGFVVQNIGEATVDRETARLGLDRNGSMLLAAEAAQGATTDIVTYRGDMAGGFGAQTVLDQFSNAASLVAATVGRNGHQAVVWTQNNGVQPRYFTATSETASGAWQVTDLAAVVTTLDKRALAVSDAGTVTFHDIYRRKMWRRAAEGAWSAEISLPSNAVVPDNDWQCAVARNGDTLCTETAGFNQNGRWTTFDAANNVLVKRAASAAPGDYLLGVDTINRSVGYAFPLLAPNGIGFMSLRNRYDVLPSATLPAGQSRSVSNLWGVVLK